jgi:ankyrin repeat protein
VMLQFVDPNVLSGDEDEPLEAGNDRATMLHQLTELVDPCDYSTHENQLILGKQLIEHGAKVNAVSIPQGATPLHMACASCNVTNLDFVEFLLVEGADPNTQDLMGLTPLMYTLLYAPGAAKFLLKWPTTDVNLTTRSGASFLAMIRRIVEHFSDNIPHNSDRVQSQFLLRQWREIEEMLVERDAHDIGVVHMQG